MNHSKQKQLLIGVVTGIVAVVTVFLICSAFGIEIDLIQLRLLAYIAIALACGFAALEIHRQRKLANGLIDGFATLKNELGVVIVALDPRGKIRVRGEVWNARESAGDHLPAGTEVRVVGAKNNCLLVDLATTTS